MTLWAGVLAVGTVHAAGSDSLFLRRLSNEILTSDGCYENLRTLTKTIGHRLSGSLAAEKAVAWGKAAMEAAGADTVWLQPVDVPVWVRGEEKLLVKIPDRNDYVEIPMLSLGNTEGTGGEWLDRDVICVPDLDAFDQLTEQQVKGKIVFFDYKFRQDIVNTFEGYGDAVKYRWLAVNKASQKSAAATIIRSVGTSTDDAPHTGSSRYNEGVKPIPALAIGNVSADLLARSCREGTTRARLMSHCGMKGTARSYNVIGQVWGSEKPDEILLVGGHLDSWDVGEGAHDDGAGCVQSIEVLRSIKALGDRPRHTVRAVLFMNEENGVRGGNAYADSAVKYGQKHLLALESDAGGFSPRGIGLEVPPDMKNTIRSWAPLFLPYGVYDFDQEGAGVDIGPLGKKLGVPLAELLPDSQRYFDLHHSRNDVFEAVHPRELKLGAWAMAALIWMADRHF